MVRSLPVRKTPHVRSTRLKGLTPVDATQTPLKTEINQALFNGLTPITVVNHRVCKYAGDYTYTKKSCQCGRPRVAWFPTTIRDGLCAQAVWTTCCLAFSALKLSKRTPPKVRSETQMCCIAWKTRKLSKMWTHIKTKLLVVRNGQTQTAWIRKFQRMWWIAYTWWQIVLI